MATLRARGIPLSAVSPHYLHANSTSHTGPFSAIAELIDNAYDPDVSAKQFWIDKTVMKGQDCLIFMDNGNGMDYGKMHKMLSVAPEYEECLHDILKYSLFNTKEELLKEFWAINVQCGIDFNGTRIIIWNLHKTSSGKLEFDFTKDRYDIWLPVDINDGNKETNKGPESEISAPESEYSLRAYTSILYLKPRMQIIICGKRVKTQLVSKSLAHVIRDTYKPTFLKKGIKITVGYNTWNKEHYGLMMYYKNRLIIAYELVACQRKINPRYLHSNSTSHTWPFSAVAELIDNAYDPDVGANQLWIEKTTFKQTDSLIFIDNGQGMNYDKMHKMLSFGYSDKQAVKGHAPVGLYGNGFKSGSMRLGKDAIVFSKQADTMCVGLLSQTYLERTGAQNVIVPIVKFTYTGQTIRAAPEHAESLRDILTHSLFNTVEELQSEFSTIEKLSSSSGTRIIIWNLRTKSSGELELDFMKDPKDIRILDDVYKTFRDPNKRQGQESKSVPESVYSLRAYCKILYLKPRMEIILQGEKVKAQCITTTLAKPRSEAYKPDCLKKGLPITFGYNKKSKEHYGLMMYHQNRLIKAYVRVSCQRKTDNTGEGVIGVIECNHLKPTHNKQDFDDTQEYRNTMKNLNNKLEQYWRDVSYSYHGFNVKNTENSTDEEPEDSVVEPPGNLRTYKQHAKNQMLQLEKKNKQQSLSKSRTSTQTTPSSTLIFRSLTGEGSSSSGDIVADTQEISASTTPRQKRAIGQCQENTEKKKAKRIDFANNTPDPSTSTDSPVVQLLQAKQEIHQLQQKVKCLEDENCALTSLCESLKKELEETNKKSDEGCGATQQHQTQDRPESMQGNSDTQIYRLRLRELRQRVARLLSSLVPALNQQQINYDCEDIDDILTQVIDKI